MYAAISMLMLAGSVVVEASGDHVSLVNFKDLVLLSLCEGAVIPLEIVCTLLYVCWCWQGL